MTIHDSIAAAFSTRVGGRFSTGEIISIVMTESDARSGSILPSNHADKGRCWCVGTEFQIFNRVAPATYEVRDFTGSAPSAFATLLPSSSQPSKVTRLLRRS